MHGGDIYHNEIELDFSVNVNPLGIPEGVRSALLSGIDASVHYPDHACRRLKEALEAKYKVPSCQIVCGNGASELFMAIARLANGKKVMIPSPGFTGYLHAIRSAGAKGIYYGLSEDRNFVLDKVTADQIADQIRRQRPDLFILTNPNNPNGALTGSEEISLIADACESTGTVLVIDECFIELISGSSDAPDTLYLLNQKHGKVILVRAFTKSVAIPGIRIGYCFCSSKEMADKIRAQLPEWNVSVPAQLAGVAALKEDAYLAISRELIGREMEYLVRELRGLGIKVFHSDANFLLFYEDQVPDLKAFLIGRHILIRDCSDYQGLREGFYRIAVKRHEENERLILELSDIFGKFCG